MKGAGCASGAVLNLPVSGNLQPMETTITFHTNTKQSLSFFTGEGQMIRCLSSILNVDTAVGKFSELPEELDMMVFSSSYDPAR